MIGPAKSTVRNACAARKLDQDTAWAVVVASEGQRILFGVRATEMKCDLVADAAAAYGCTGIEIVPVRELMGAAAAESPT